MFKHYLLIAWRTALRQRAYAAINVVGLGGALAFCLLCFLFVRFEWGYDGFHENGDRIYRVYAIFGTPDGGTMRMADFAELALGPALGAGVPEAVRAVRVKSGRSDELEDRVTRVARGDAQADEEVLLVDEGFLQMFTFPLAQGDPRTALKERNSVVLGRALARRFFGGEDPIGQTLTVRSIWHDGMTEEFAVTGVLAPLPQNSTLQPELVFPMANAHFFFHEDPEAWEHSCNVYLELAAGADPEAVAGKAAAIAAEHMLKPGMPKDALRFGLQPLAELHTDTGFFTWIGHGIKGQRSPLYAYVLASVAALVMALACINFTNLALGRAATRYQEVGVRKIVGATRGQLLAQFGGEAVLTALAALVLGVALAELLLPVFNGLLGLDLALDYGRPSTLGALAALALGVGALAGGYPALVLSRFQPLGILGGRLLLGGRGRLSRALVVFQFAASVFLIACGAVMHGQMAFITDKELGFNQHRLIAVNTEELHEMGGLQGRLKELCLRHERVAAATMVRYHLMSGSFHRGTEARAADGREIETGRYWVDYDFVAAMEMTLLQGRDFSPELDELSNGSMIVNRTFVEQMGWDEPIGQRLQFESPRLLRKSEGWATVVGVVEDYHFTSLHQPAQPMALLVNPSIGDESKLLVVRVAPGDLEGALAHIEAQWRQVGPEFEFRYSFVDQDLARYYAGEQTLARAVRYGAFFAVGVAALGALGLALLSSGRRTKEVGIRKALGASSGQIVGLLTRDVLALVAVATVLALPVVHYAMTLWLENFAYRIDSLAGYALLGGAMMLALAGLTVGLQALMTARTDPVAALRYE